jgi:hypothetical protein
MTRGVPGIGYWYCWDISNNVRRERRGGKDGKQAGPLKDRPSLSAGSNLNRKKRRAEISGVSGGIVAVERKVGTGVLSDGVRVAKGRRIAHGGLGRVQAC